MKAHHVLVVSGSRESALTLCSGVKLAKKNLAFPPLSSTQPIVQTNITWYNFPFPPNLFHTPNPFDLSRGRWDVTHRAASIWRYIPKFFLKNAFKWFTSHWCERHTRFANAQHVLAPSELWNNCFYCTTKFNFHSTQSIVCCSTAFFLFLSFFLSFFLSLTMSDSVSYVIHIMLYLWPGVITLKQVVH